MSLLRDVCVHRPCCRRHCRAHLVQSFTELCSTPSADRRWPPCRFGTANAKPSLDARYPSRAQDGRCGTMFARHLRKVAIETDSPGDFADLRVDVLFQIHRSQTEMPQLPVVPAQTKPPNTQKKPREDGDVHISSLLVRSEKRSPGTTTLVRDKEEEMFF